MLRDPAPHAGAAYDLTGPAALTLPEAVVNQFDIVGLDPRGTGLSTPVECISDEQKDELFAADPRVIDAAAQDALFSEIEEVAAGCDGLLGLTRALAVEWAPRSIRVASS